MAAERDDEMRDQMEAERAADDAVDPEDMHPGEVDFPNCLPGLKDRMEALHKYVEGNKDAVNYIATLVISTEGTRFKGYGALDAVDRDRSWLWVDYMQRELVHVRTCLSRKIYRAAIKSMVTCVWKYTMIQILADYVVPCLPLAEVTRIMQECIGAVAHPRVSYHMQFIANILKPLFHVNACCSEETWPSRAMNEFVATIVPVFRARKNKRNLALDEQKHTQSLQVRLLHDIVKNIRDTTTELVMQTPWSDPQVELFSDFVSLFHQIPKATVVHACMAGDIVHPMNPKSLCIVTGAITDENGVILSVNPAYYKVQDQMIDMWEVWAQAQSRIYRKTLGLLRSTEDAPAVAPGPDNTCELCLERVANVCAYPCMHRVCVKCMSNLMVSMEHRGDVQCLDRQKQFKCAHCRGPIVNVQIAK